jgi:two-component system, NarL family, invasion response regulator UvrY
MISILKPINIAYADDHVAVRKGIKSIIEEDSNIRVVIEGNDGQQLLEKLILADTRPDLCLIDLHMPEMNGFILLKEIRKRWPKLPAIILSAFAEEYHILEMIRSGANGYLLKSCRPEEIISAIQNVINKGYHYNNILSEEKTEQILALNPKAIKLNEREIQLLELVCTELNYAEIAQQLNTSFKTIDGIRARLCEKLSIHSRVGLAITAIRLGYYSIENDFLLNQK